MRCRSEYYKIRSRQCEAHIFIDHFATYKTGTFLCKYLWKLLPDLSPFLVSQFWIICHRHTGKITKTKITTSTIKRQLFWSNNSFYTTIHLHTNNVCYKNIEEYKITAQYNSIEKTPYETKYDFCERTTRNTTKTDRDQWTVNFAQEAAAAATSCVAIFCFTSINFIAFLWKSPHQNWCRFVDNFF